MADSTEPDPLSRLMLAALQGKHIYGGTVDSATVAKRRAANRQARRARRTNRKSR